ncbi:hypothetical protein PSHT_10299, partial [Puccinia striiformis]
MVSLERFSGRNVARNWSRLPIGEDHNAGNTDDILHLSLAPPQIRPAYEAHHMTSPSTDLSLGIQPVSENLEKTILTDFPSTGNGQASIGSYGAEAAIAFPCTTLSLSTPSGHAARYPPIDALTSVRVHQESMNFDQGSVARNSTLAASFSDTSPGHLKFKGKLDDDAPSSSIHQPLIFPILRNTEERTYQSDLHQERLPTNHYADHQSREVEKSSFYPTSGRETSSFPWFIESGFNPGSKPSQAALDQVTNNPTSNEVALTAALPTINATPAQQSAHHIYMPGRRSSKRPSILPAEGMTIPSLPIETAHEIASDNRALTVARKRAKLEEIFEFDVELFQSDQHRSKREKEKVAKMISRIRSLKQNDQLKISQMDSKQVRDFFRGFSKLGRPPQKNNRIKNNRGSTRPFRMKTQQDPLSSVSLLARPSNADRQERMHYAMHHLDSEQTHWFEFWGERAGIDLKKINSLQAKTKGHVKDYSGRDFALFLFHIDMIGTILEEYCLRDSESADCGAKLIKEAVQLFEQSILKNSFRKHRFNRNPLETTTASSTNKKETVEKNQHPMIWIWECIQTFIFQSKEQRLIDIFFPDGKLVIHNLTRAFFTDVFIYTIKKKFCPIGAPSRDLNRPRRGPHQGISQRRPTPLSSRLNRPQGISRLPKVMYDDYGASNTDDILRLSLAPPQSHHRYEAEPTIHISTELSLGNDPVTKIFGKNFRNDDSGPGNQQASINPYRAQASSAFPSVTLSLATPSVHAAGKFLTDGRTSDRELQAFINSDQADVTSKLPLDATSSETSPGPGHLELRGKEDDDAPSWSNYQYFILPVLQNSEDVKSLQANHHRDHQTLELQHTSFHTTSPQNELSPSRFTGRGPKSLSNLSKVNIDRLDNRPTLNEATSASPLHGAINAIPKHQSLKHIQMPHSRSPKRPSVLSNEGSLPQVGHLQVQPTKKQKFGQPRTDATDIHALSIKTPRQSGRASTRTKCKTQGYIFKFDVDLFQRDQYESNGDKEKVAMIIPIIQSLQQDNQLKISKMKPWEVRQFFRRFSSNGLHKINKMGSKHSRRKKAQGALSSVPVLPSSAYADRQHRMSSAVNLLDLQQENWFEFWRERTGIDVKRINSLQIKTKNTKKDCTGRDFGLLLLHIDMIGTILEEYCMKNSETVPLDCGAKLIKEAMKLFEPSILENTFRKHKFLGNSVDSNTESTRSHNKEAMIWLWEWIQTIIHQSEEERLKEIIFSDGEKAIHNLTRAFFHDVFGYSFEKLDQKISSYLKTKAGDGYSVPA